MTIVGNTDYSQRLGRLATQLVVEKLDAFLQPVNDAFQSEYPPESARRLQYITGFSGSAGMGAFFATPVQGKRAALFVDGRYTLQAAQQAAAGDYHIFNSAGQALENWLASVAKEQGRDVVVGYDPWLQTAAQARRWEKAFEQTGVCLKAVAVNPIDKVWDAKPPSPSVSILAHPLQYAGESSDSKRKRLGELLTQAGADAALLTLPDGINWLLNIRGNDSDYNPLALCFALLEANGRVVLFLNGHPVEEGALDAAVTCAHIHELEHGPQVFFAPYKKVMFDSAVSADWFLRQIQDAGIEIVEKGDPTLFAKACKNQVEIDGIRAAHKRDGQALTRFLNWLDDYLPTGTVSEIAAEEKLEEFRKEKGGNLYRGPSFATISGSGPHGAIVHYRATEASNRLIGRNEIYLVDSGGQYPDGTTDVTRTVISGTPTEEMQDRFTRVLKGHIAIATAVFPAGTTGGQLDALARHFLWEAGLDYDHGTGHGVGAYLCVHEGPQRISKRGGDAPLMPGMVVSNEPGYYKSGEYGIRIENLVLVKECSDKPGFLCFETLTLAAIDQRLIDESLLTDQEKHWLSEYHRRVEENSG